MQRNIVKLFNATKIYLLLISVFMLETSDGESSTVQVHTNDSGNSRFLCVVCGKSFRCKSHHDVHYLKPSREKPFLCTKCGVRFISKHNLKRHMENSHKENSAESRTKRSAVDVHVASVRNHSNSNPTSTCITGKIPESVLSYVHTAEVDSKENLISNNT